MLNGNYLHYDNTRICDDNKDRYCGSRGVILIHKFSERNGYNCNKWIGP